MPIYSFEIEETGEQFSLMCTDKEREEFLDANPGIIQILETINIGDPIKLGVTKPHSDFTNHVLKPIKKAHPLGTGMDRRIQTNND